MTTAPAGQSLTVSGINEVRTIACNGGSVNVSGIANEVVITGHCKALTVSGVRNKVTVDAADSIQASGFNNQITYHTGSPQIDQSGQGNVDPEGLSLQTASSRYSPMRPTTTIVARSAFGDSRRP